MTQWARPLSIAASIVCTPRGLLALFGASSGPVPPFDPALLNSKGSLFLTRPTLWHYIATRAELEWRAGDVLNWAAKGELKLRTEHTYPLAEAARAQIDLEDARPRERFCWCRENGHQLSASVSPQSISRRALSVSLEPRARAEAEAELGACMRISVLPTDRVFVLTGAGISAESGLPTFRASDGLWAGYNVEEICTPEALRRNPALVWDFYSKRRADCEKAQPNPAHYRSCRARSATSRPLFLCTQNVDDLHERAGSVNLVHMHGELAKPAASASAAARRSKIAPSTRALTRSATAFAADAFARTLFSSARFLSRCRASSAKSRESTLMLVIGTSGSVYPAANFVHWARQAGARTVYIGPEPPLNASAFTHVVEGKAGEVLPGLFIVE